MVNFLIYQKLKYNFLKTFTGKKREAKENSNPDINVR